MNPSAFSKIWTITIFIVLIAGGIFAWQYFGKQSEQPNTSEITKDETADWQIYRNEEFGFEVRYPEDRVGVDKDGFFYIHSDEHVVAEEQCKKAVEEFIKSGIVGDYGPCLFGIFISVQSKKKWMEQYLIEAYYPLVAVEGVLKLNRDFYPPALVVAVPLLREQDRFVVFEAYDIYRRDGSTSEDGKLLDQILSTFRFME